MRAAPLLLIALTVAACGEKPAPATVVPVVRTLVAGEAAADAGRTYSGDLHARYEMPLAFRVGGKLLDRKVDAGSHVAAGQLLARLDPADMALQAAQADSQYSLALADAKRYRELRTKNFVSAAALEAKETALKAAESQAGLSRNQAAYTHLTADRAGVVAAVLAEPGQVVAAGQAVFRLAQDGEREVSISVPESEVATIHVGDEAEITLWSGGRTYRGRVRELSPAADAATRTFAARVTVLDPDAAVALGMTAAVRFPSGSAPALTVPLAALFQQVQGHDGPAVWVVGADETVALRPVTTAAYTDAGAVIAEGLKPGERIVAAGVHKLSAGQKVRVVQ